jgi:hypothetical protein
MNHFTKLRVAALGSVVSALATHTFYIQMGFLAARNRQRQQAAMACERWI